MTDHEITTEVHGEGRINRPGDWEIIGVAPGTWECSCGESFEDIEDAWDHYEENA